MTERKKPCPGGTKTGQVRLGLLQSTRPGEETRPLKSTIAGCGIVVYSKGVRYRPSATVWRGQTPPVRTAGDIKGWSLQSRRRMREFLMTHIAPVGFRTVAVDLTYPALPVGSESPVVGREDAISIFRAFAKRLTRAGWGFVWRLEVQPRKTTRRQDICGMAQPHYHCIAICPADCEPMLAKDAWLSVLGERGKVRGAAEHAANVAVCDGWSVARIRYLQDHATKAKYEQIAVGWGRHWGVVNRGVWAEDKGEMASLTLSEQYVAARILRKLIRRRIPDIRGCGGFDFARLAFEDTARGLIIKGLGWSFFESGGCYKRLWHDRVFRRHIERRITWVEGKNRLNVWALKLAKERSPVGWRFGVDGHRLCSAAVEVVRLKGGNAKLEKERLARMEARQKKDS